MKGLCLILIVVVLATAQDERYYTPEQFILAQGIPVITYNVGTKDGFVLQVQRMKREGAAAVYLQHGLLDSSCTWVMNTRVESLGFALYDAGYDVWLGNSRGNRFSNQMVNGSHFDWYWSMDELAQYDVDAVLNFVTNTTGKDRIAWIGHSRGTQMMFYGLSRFPQYAKKINIFIALAPVAWVANAKVPLITEIARIDDKDLLDRLGYHDFLPRVDADQLICRLIPGLCDDVMSLLFGPGTSDPRRFNQTRLPVYLGHFPAGTSSQEMAHYAQLVNTASLNLYDFMSEEANRAHYGTPKPPAYNLTDIPSSPPIALFTGGNDALADPTDVMRLIATMGSKRFVLIQDTPQFNHADFVIGATAYQVIFPSIFQLLSKYNTD